MIYVINLEKVRPQTNPTLWISRRLDKSKVFHLYEGGYAGFPNKILKRRANLKF